MRKRQVVRSDGIKFPSLIAAANAHNSTTQCIWLAVRATKQGVYRSVQGFQFAYEGEEPNPWPCTKCVKRDSQEVVKDWICPDITKVFGHWQVIPGLSDYEVSIYGYVRKNSEREKGALPRIYQHAIALVVIDGKRYSIPELLMLTFVGPKPFGYRLVKLKGIDNRLSNLAYERVARAK
jgi:hypothetical protein